MKNYILSFICLFVLNMNQYGQENSHQFSFTDSTFWRTYDIDIRTNGIKYSSLTFLNGDTILNGYSYKKLFTGNYHYNGSVRTNENKIYAELDFFQPQELGEILLYDFSVNIGDTIKSNVTAGVLSRSPIITEIDTIELNNNEKRKRYFLNRGEDIWIEGVGSIFGFLYPAFDFATNYTVTYLVCFKQNNQILYRNDTLCRYNCCNTEIGMELKHNIFSNSFNCYPNPTTGMINIEIDNMKINDSYPLKIYNIVGDVIFSTNLNHDKFQIDLSAFEGSVFILSLIQGNTETHYKIIKH